MKTKIKNLFFLFVLGFLGIYGPVPNQAFTQTPDYILAVDDNGDSTCFEVLGVDTLNVPCEEMLSYLNSPPPNDVPATEEEVKEKFDFIAFAKKAGEFIVEYWYVWILPLLDTIVRMTPTEKDNNILRIIQSWIDKIIPNKRKDGGRFVAFDDKESAPKIGYVGDKKTAIK